MIWNYFIIFAAVSVIFWSIGAVAAWRDYKQKYIYASTFFGLATFFAFIILLWISLSHPPMRTMGETRLWYSFFLPLAGIITYARRRYKWILTFSTVLSSVFICINLFNPGVHSKALMPALQSPWFSPHVMVYMFAYALLGAAAISSVYLLCIKRRKMTSEEIEGCDDLVYIGLSFLTVGMLFGALWAKEAWGEYWTWDPKETWAAVTWFSYLLYIHYRFHAPERPRTALIILLISFAFLQMCWWGIDYLPAAQNMSMHTYDLN